MAVVVGDEDPSLSLEDVSMVTDNWGSGAGRSCFTFKNVKVNCNIMRIYVFDSMINSQLFFFFNIKQEKVVKVSIRN